jgi:hypothetical protein
MHAGWGKGVVVGFVNLVVVAIAIAVFIHEASCLEVVASVMLIGFLPAVLYGALVGHLASEAQRRDRRIVLAVMIAISCACVAMLGGMFDLQFLVPYACIPTAASCAVLERWTRSNPDAIPFARVA